MAKNSLNVAGRLLKSLHYYWSLINSVVQFPFQEVELKKKAEEEAKAKEMEEMAEVEKEETSEPQLLELKVRLDKLEEAVKEIVVESRKESPDAIGKNSKIGSQVKQPAIAGESNTSKSPQAGNSDAKDYPNKKTSRERIAGPPSQGKTDASS